jgi:hypothetical protein
VSAAPLWRPNVVTIGNDRGGQLITYALRMKRLEKKGTPTRFRGRCDSACTLYLALPPAQTCIMPGATFGFHLPYGASEAGNRVAVRYMQRLYPGWVRSWLQSKGGLRRTLKKMSYEYASKHIRPCKFRTAFRLFRAEKSNRQN